MLSAVNSMDYFHNAIFTQSLVHEMKDFSETLTSYSLRHLSLSLSQSLTHTCAHFYTHMFSHPCTHKIVRTFEKKT